MSKYDAVVVGSGPNGLSAAITLQQFGCSVLLIEGANVIGGGLRSKELTLPGFVHDVCSAVHPLAAVSPFFSSIPLEKFGLEFLYPKIELSHPFDDGSACVIKRSINETAFILEKGDGLSYKKLIEPIYKNWNDISKAVFSPFFPFNKNCSIKALKFGFKAIASAKKTADLFSSTKTKSLWAGIAAHSSIPLTNTGSSGAGLILAAAAHLRGWPIVKGGSQSMANSLSSYFIALGGRIEKGTFLRSLKDLPLSKAVLFDTTPKQLIEICGKKLNGLYRWQLNGYEYGMGVFKIDWALNSPIPFLAKECKDSVTLHLGGFFNEIEKSEWQSWNKQHSDKPFIILVQPTIIDEARAPAGMHIAWAYCHVPYGSSTDMTKVIEDQVERFAPGFKDCIIKRNTLNCLDFQKYNPNYIGGDIGGGATNFRQVLIRPALQTNPYKTSLKGIYLCSSSTSPGPGVHGMCGYNSAKQVIKDLF